MPAVLLDGLRVRVRGCDEVTEHRAEQQATDQQPPEVRE